MVTPGYIDKIKDGNWLKIIDNKVVLCDIPTFEEWCKVEKLPRDSTARLIYNTWKQDAPTLLKIVQSIFSEDIESARKMINKLADKEAKIFNYKI